LVVPPIPARSTALDTDVQDCINDGIIMVGAAGNYYFNCEEYGGVDYNNTITKDGVTYYHSRGSSPSAASNCICVGNIDSKVSEHKSATSQWGGRVDVWAPGSNIMSASYSQFVDYYDTIADPRNGSYFFTRVSGTSMASPQVTGLLACLCEQEPNLTQAEALQYIKESALPDVADNGNNPNQSGHIGFGDSNNRYLFDKRKRPIDGMAHPAVLHKNRNTTTAGVKYPRVRNNRTTK
jgi:subtilisin family serine protease